MKKIFGLLLFYFAFLNLNAQDFQGIAYYQTKTTMSFGSWGDKMTSEQKKIAVELMKLQASKDIGKLTEEEFTEQKKKLL